MKRQVDGDWSDPVTYGGTFYDEEANLLILWDGLDAYPVDYAKANDMRFPVYHFEPMEVEDLTNGWYILKEVSSFTGEAYDLTTLDGRIQATLDVASYYGAHELDHYPQTYHVLAIYSKMRSRM